MGSIPVRVTIEGNVHQDVAFFVLSGLLSDDQKPEKTGKPHQEHESETADLMYLKRSAGVVRFRGAFGSCFADWFGINGLPVTR